MTHKTMFYTFLIALTVTTLMAVFPAVLCDSVDSAKLKNVQGDNNKVIRKVTEIKLGKRQDEGDDIEGGDDEDEALAPIAPGLVNGLNQLSSSQLTSPFATVAPLLAIGFSQFYKDLNTALNGTDTPNVSSFLLKHGSGLGGLVKNLISSNNNGRFSFNYKNPHDPDYGDDEIASVQPTTVAPPLAPLPPRMPQAPQASYLPQYLQQQQQQFHPIIVSANPTAAGNPIRSPTLTHSIQTKPAANKVHSLNPQNSGALLLPASASKTHSIVASQSNSHYYPVLNPGIALAVLRKHSRVNVPYTGKHRHTVLKAEPLFENQNIIRNQVIIKNDLAEQRKTTTEENQSTTEFSSVELDLENEVYATSSPSSRTHIVEIVDA